MSVLYFLLIAVLVAADQLTKYLAVTYLKPIGTLPLIENVLHLTYTTNTGTAFGMLKDARWLFMTVSVVIVAVILFLLIRRKKELKPVVYFTLAVVCAGGIGNLIDRFALGYVVDFIDFRIINFAIFNFADMCVTCGEVFLIILLLTGRFDPWFGDGKAIKNSGSVKNSGGDETCNAEGSIEPVSERTENAGSGEHGTEDHTEVENLQDKEQSCQ